MLGFNRWHLFKGLAAILCILGIVSLALLYFFPAPPSTIAFASGFPGGSYELLGARYKEILARSGVILDPRITDGAVENLELLKDPTSAVPAGLVQGGISNGKQAPMLLSLGRINYQIFCVFYRETDALDDLTDLKGKRIAVGPVGSGFRVVSEKILGISGVTSETSTLLPLGGQAAVNALVDSKADAAIIGLSSDSTILRTLLRDSRVRLMNVKDAEAITRFFPFIVRLVLPRGAIDFEKKIPVSDTVLIATTNSVLVRNDLHPALISLLAQAILETHNVPGLFQRANEFPMQTDSEFPMAESAVDFYKNGFPLLDKYLPHWIVPHVQRFLAVLLTAGAIVFPVFSLAPKLFKWLVDYRLSSMYSRLRMIEAKLQKDVTASEIAALRTELGSIDREISILGVPKQHSDLFFSIKSHIDVVRTRLDLRSAELQGIATQAA